MENFKLVVLSGMTARKGQLERMINISMKTSDFLSQFARDKELREARTNQTPLASINSPVNHADVNNDSASEFPMGYTRTRGVRMHIRVTNTEVPDNPESHDDVRSSGDARPAKRERLVDKNAGPVLALMSVPVAKGKHQG